MLARLVLCFLILAPAAAFGDYTAGPTFDYFSKTAYKDRDWNVTFYENCDLPAYSSTQWVMEEGERFLRFTLKNGQVGGCSTDNRARHRAPWWERAEMKQTETLEQNRDYRLTFRVRFVKGFNTEREGFFQIHQYLSDCRVGPVFMAKFYDGHLRDNDGNFSTVHIHEVLGKWHNIRFDFNTSKSYVLYFNGKEVMSGDLYRLRSCGGPHLKMGIYRPGDANATGDRLSIVDIDKVSLEDRK